MKKCEGEQASINLLSKISQIKRQIQSSRLASINLKLKKNKTGVVSSTSHLLELAMSKMVISISEPSGLRNMLSYRIESPPCKLSGSVHGLGEKDNANCQEVLPSTSIKLPFVEKIPPYTSWIFLDKNQRMAEDQSVVGRRQIYYDQYGGETLICSDSEEEIAEPVEEKHEFSEGEDQLLWKASQDNGMTQEVLDILVQFIEATSSEIQDRCTILMEKHQERNAEKNEESVTKVSEKSIFLEKSLSAALDSFDNLFCRRCLVFDCRLHGCSQSLITPSEKQCYVSEAEENKKPCGDQCYLWSRKSIAHVTEGSDTSTSNGIEAPKDKYSTSFTPEGRCSFRKTTDVSSDVNIITEVSVECLENNEYVLPEESNGEKRKVEADDDSIPGSNDLQGSVSKKQKKISTLDVINVPSEVEVDSANLPRASNVDSDAASPNNNDQKNKNIINEIFEYGCNRHIFQGGGANDEDIDNVLELDTNDLMELPGKKKIPIFNEGKLKGNFSGCEWKPIEKELYLKGVEIFGKNSCLIARNLLSGLKTCKEVSAFMFEDEAMPQRSALLSNLCLEDNGKAEIDYMEQETSRSRIFRRRGRTRKLKYTWKSAGHPSIRKRIADGKHQSCKQYTPCGCLVMCGKQCSCLHNGTCCEKYCGCSKSCKNRFRGCHCAKSQCRSRQCPCFAAGRECDPDVCRNCWVSCGDGSLGEPPARGDGYQCGNMRLLLRQQQRILLAKSDVAGWGAFLKNPVNKNDYLGEYTGELISHREADKRGKIYDRANSSFLFDLNDQYVLDAYRKGDKLKFANHSSNPNCYAKVMLVAGDHRVGIFAKEHIEASEELFYDYRYCPDQAPVWARKPEGSKRDDSMVSHGRAQKHQSH